MLTEASAIGTLDISHAVTETRAISVSLHREHMRLTSVIGGAQVKRVDGVCDASCDFSIAAAKVSNNQ